jgi:hypothetical protein
MSHKNSHNVPEHFYYGFPHFAAFDGNIIFTGCPYSTQAINQYK